MVITHDEQVAGASPAAQSRGRKPMDKEQQRAWEALRANAMNHTVIEEGQRLLSNVEEITGQSLLACYGEHCFTISN
jgi:hypothetical protein